jgi:AcrR family transcriptional regulator
MPAPLRQSALRLAAEKPNLPDGVVDGGSRARILEAGLLLFATRGYHATTMRELAKEVGHQPGALYVHFPSKEHVLAELVRLGHEAHHRGLRAALMASGASPVEQIRTVARAHTRFHADYGMLAVLIQDEMHGLSAGLGGAARALRQQSVALIQEVVERGIEQGIFDVPNAFVVTAAIGAIGMRVAHWFGPDARVTAKQLAEMHAEFAVRLLGAS